MQTRTNWPKDHPQILLNTFLEKSRRKLQAFTTEELDASVNQSFLDLEEIGEDVSLIDHPQHRHQKLNFILAQVEKRYYFDWKARYGWPFADVRDPEKYNEHCHKMRADLAKADMEIKTAGMSRGVSVIPLRIYETPTEGASEGVSSVRIMREVAISQRIGKGMSYSLLWQFPGGKVEPGEEPIMAAMRELREEAGLDLGQHRLMDLGWEIITRDDKTTYAAFRFGIILDYEGPEELINCEPDKHSDWRWVPIEQMLETSETCIFPMMKGVTKWVTEFVTLCQQVRRRRNPVVLPTAIAALASSPLVQKHPMMRSRAQLKGSVLRTSKRGY